MSVAKILKPVMEKRRRERINQSLEELRLLLLQITGDQKLQNPKLEKAEILELTVHYLRGKARLKPDGAASGEKNSAEICYLSGFRECLLRMSFFLKELEPSIQRRFLESLQAHMQLKNQKTADPEPSSSRGEPAFPLQSFGCSQRLFTVSLLEDLLANPTRVPFCLGGSLSKVPDMSRPCTPSYREEPQQPISPDSTASPQHLRDLPGAQRQRDVSGSSQERKIWRPWP
ncbi:transcription factor HES-7 [Microcaecilia unicolor]|uniref:Transcription factor HES-7 n=1 Tax=Microcaecilia unicolor TaxID=1415580 RepID=A0A6P7WVM0_9AMPH|nr:transcription factor HES-7 [Microcaecilia unicolor]